MISIKSMVDRGKKVHFSWYREGELWYVTDCGFEFPVPVSDIGNALLLKEDKAIFFMRYIRKHVEMLETAKQQ